MKRPDIHKDKWLLSHPFRRAILRQSATRIRCAMIRKWFFDKLYKICKKNKAIHKKVQWVLKNQTLLWCKLTWLTLYYKTIGKHIFFSNFGSEGWKTCLKEWGNNPGRLIKGR